VTFDFAVTRVENLGSDRYVYGHLPDIDPDAKVIAKLPSTVTTPITIGDRVPFAVDRRDVLSFDRGTGKRAASADTTVIP
jgi:multiple sugar transport system ATP-binding protein